MHIKGDRIRIEHKFLGTFEAVYDHERGPGTHGVKVQSKVTMNKATYYPDDLVFINFEECKVEIINL